MKEIKISIRTNGDEITLISDVKKMVMEKHGIKENNIIHRVKIIGDVGK